MLIFYSTRYFLRSLKIWLKQWWLHKFSDNYPWFFDLLSYRMTHLLGKKNLPLTWFPQFWQLVGCYCSILLSRQSDGTSQMQVKGRLTSCYFPLPWGWPWASRGLRSGGCPRWGDRSAPSLSRRRGSPREEPKMGTSSELKSYSQDSHHIRCLDYFANTHWYNQSGPGLLTEPLLYVNKSMCLSKYVHNLAKKGFGLVWWILPKLACSIHATLGPPFIRALYSFNN